MLKRTLLTLLCVCAVGIGSAALRDYKIIVTTPGYTSVYSYDNEDFAVSAAKDLHILAPIEVAESECTMDTSRTMVCIKVGADEFNFAVNDVAPVVRLIYDRNRRTFTGAGFNCVGTQASVCEAPVFKGTRIDSISYVLAKDVERYIGDKSLLSADSSTVFFLEADIDENGIVHKVVELSGGLKQYSKVIIDRFYDKAVRGWEPAKIDGVPVRSLAQFRFELSR